MECPICTLRYDAKARIPVVIKCGHSLCQVCLKELPERKCPLCCGRFSSYSQNFALKEAVSKIQNPQSQKVDYCGLYKIIIVGESGVGKTSIFTAFTNGNFTENQPNTLGMGFFFANETHNGKTYKFQMWDTGGQQKFRAITRNYFSQSDLVILTYSLESLETFQQATNYWANQSKLQAPESKIMLIGNKLDRQRRVPEELIQKFRKKFPCMQAKVSCKNGTNIQETWALISQMLRRQCTGKSNSYCSLKASRMAESVHQSKSRCKC